MTGKRVAASTNGLFPSSPLIVRDTIDLRFGMRTGTGDADNSAFGEDADRLQFEGTPDVSTTTEITTAEELLRNHPPQRCELIRGELRLMSPAGNEHGRIAIRLGMYVEQSVLANRLGATYAAETGFIIERDPDTVRAPDVAFVTQKRLDEIGPVKGFWPGAPDLAAEVVSPDDSFSEVESKALAWLAAGTAVVWVVDPKQRNVTVYRNADDIVVLDEDSTLEASDLLPEFTVRVGDLFPD